MRTLITVFIDNERLLTYVIGEDECFVSDPVPMGDKMVVVTLKASRPEDQENKIELAKRITRISMLKALMTECFLDEIEEAIREMHQDEQD